MASKLSEDRETMSANVGCQSSRWIDFLRHYGPIPNNDTMYDEQIQNALKRAKVEPIKFDTQYLAELISNYRNSIPRSIILTGTAGDGKTFYCREIWEALGGSPEVWRKGEEIQRLEIGSGELVIVKDLTAMDDGPKKQVVSQLAEAVLASEPKTFFLIAANDGQLMEALSAPKSESDKTLQAAVEELLVSERRHRDGSNLLLYNLSRSSASDMIARIADAVLNHSGWSDCNACPYSEVQNNRSRCPILENRDRLIGSNDNQVTKVRLAELLRLCDLNGMHLSVRQLLILIANSLLGHPAAKDKLMSCKQVPGIIDAGTSSQANVYRNILGENLGERKRETTEVFATLSRFGIGTETNNRIDNMLIFGEDDPALQASFSQLVKVDPIYGADTNFSSAQKAYLENTASDQGKDFLQLLRTQRQRLFFTIPTDQASDVKLWNLTVFQSAGEYLDIFSRLMNSEKVPRATVSKLVRGLNRIFTGVLLNNVDDLILATSGSCSQAKVSLLFEESLSVPLKRGESVNVVLDEERHLPIISVSLASSDIPPVVLILNLTRFEYLCRVAEGALPSSFSQECYEDILAFKTKILRGVSQRRLLEGESQEGQLVFRFLELNSEGIARERSLEIVS